MSASLKSGVADARLTLGQYWILGLHELGWSLWLPGSAYGWVKHKGMVHGVLF
jgi:hypothetical protein